MQLAVVLTVIMYILMIVDTLLTWWAYYKFPNQFLELSPVVSFLIRVLGIDAAMIVNLVVKTAAFITILWFVRHAPLPIVYLVVGFGLGLYISTVFFLVLQVLNFK